MSDPRRASACENLAIDQDKRMPGISVGLAPCGCCAIVTMLGEDMQPSEWVKLPLGAMAMFAQNLVTVGDAIEANVTPASEKH